MAPTLRAILLAAVFAGAGPALGQTPQAPATSPDRTVLPLASPAPPAGRVPRTAAEAELPPWPTIPQAPRGAPNVIVILLDDVGFGQAGTFGGPIPTPALDRLAQQGIRYNRFHTSAICSPSRSALLTGRNPHEASTGMILEWSTPFPGYTGMIPPQTATIGQVLRGNGYATSWFGKNHNLPDWESSAAGPFTRWPAGLGFDYFFGFVAGETHQYYPVMFENTAPVEPTRTPEQGYHVTTDMTDRAIGWMRQQKSLAPDRPLFLYFAPGAMHAPHHAPAAYRERFRGQFDIGWDEVRRQTHERQLRMGIIPPGTELTPRPPEVPAWDSRSPEARRLYARLMENFAGFFAHTDEQVGRLLDAVAALPDAENTLVLFIVGDNGASAEGGFDGTLNEIAALNGVPATLEHNLSRIDSIGGPDGEPHYPVGWAWAGNAPFQWFKQNASHLGGTRNPMIVSWPARIRPDATMRTQFAHLVDIMPTVLEAAQLPMPRTVDGIEQVPLAGRSLLPTFASAAAPWAPRTQYFEVMGNLALYHDDWMLSARHTYPWSNERDRSLERPVWELYNLGRDFSQARNLAAAEPQRVREMVTLLDRELARNQVFPLDDRFAARLLVPRPTLGDPARTSFTYYPGAERIAETAAVNTKNRSHRITVRANLPQTGAEGVLVANGGGSAGYTLYIREGRLTYHYNYFDLERFVIRADAPLPAGDVEIAFDFEQEPGDQPGSGGVGRLFVNGRQVAEGRIPRTVAARFGIDTFGIGVDTGSPVSNEYAPPYRFTGTLRDVRVDLR